MTETLFVFDERNYQECQNTFRGAGNQEYYLGDYSIEAGSVIDVRADRKAVGSCSIIRLKSKTRLSFRRSWSHIREDATDLTVLWFVKRGRLCVSHQSGYSTAEAGDFVITRSMTPFFIECQPDEDSVHEVLHVVVPTHVLRSFIPHEPRTGFCVSAHGREFVVAEHILMDVFEDDGALPGHIAQMLVDSALSVLSHAIKDRDSSGPVRQSVSDKRLQDVLRFIEVHLSDPKLSITTVAKGCGISPRYLFFLLKNHGTPFSTLIWEKRLKMASRWLASSKPGDISISEIAYRAGFKSPAHFSRMFKRVYEISPRDCRSANLPVASHQRHELFASGTNSIQ
ncbi:MAG: AraC family transcriptional regulator [Rhodospirillaceae bacterium]|nr:MAG: AraC family transcriptional regulator [Rhodospirillaceae bacterium]